MPVSKTESGAKAAKPPADAAQAEAALEPLSLDGGVIVLKRVKRKKKKRRYSKGLKDIQRLERGASRAGVRLGDAAAAGFSTYRKRSNKSARRKRDGAVRDAVRNWTRALDKTLSKSSKAPYDVVKRVKTKRLWKVAKPLLQAPFYPFLR